jgi:hypothetical protein
MQRGDVVWRTRREEHGSPARDTGCGCRSPVVRTGRRVHAGRRSVKTSARTNERARAETPRCSLRPRRLWADGRPGRVACTKQASSARSLARAVRPAMPMPVAKLATRTSRRRESVSAMHAPLDMAAVMKIAKGSVTSQFLSLLKGM